MELTFFSILYIIWGVALGLIFKKACINRNCIILRAPPQKMVEENVFKFKDKCYTFSQKDSLCNKDPIRE